MNRPVRKKKKKLVVQVCKTMGKNICLKVFEARHKFRENSMTMSKIHIPDSIKRIVSITVS